MANQVNHSHECPACGKDEACASPECQALLRRVCPRCMEQAWRHARTNARRGRAAGRSLKAA